MEKKLSVLGCGWFGFALAKLMINSGWQVKGSTTSKDKFLAFNECGIDPYLVQINNDSINAENEQFWECDVLVVSFPPGLRKGNTGNYLNKIAAVCKMAKEKNIKKLVLISSTSVYSEKNQALSENNNPEPDSLNGKEILEAETLVSNFRGKYAIIRFGGLIGPGRNPARFFSGKTNIPQGLAPVNMIYLDDCTAIAKTIIEQDFKGAVNAVAPTHPSKKEFYTKACKRAGVKEPDFIDEKTSWKEINSIVLKDKLNYKFQFPDLMELLNEVDFK